jgi:hypothetical protein
MIIAATTLESFDPIRNLTSMMIRHSIAISIVTCIVTCLFPSAVYGQTRCAPRCGPDKKFFAYNIILDPVNKYVSFWVQSMAGPGLSLVSPFVCGCSRPCIDIAIAAAQGTSYSNLGGIGNTDCSVFQRFFKDVCCDTVASFNNGVCPLCATGINNQNL